jgi:hypothetical protein
MKMLSRYPSLSSDWLLFGKGEMSREKDMADLFDSPSFLNINESEGRPANQLIDKNKTREDIIKSELPSSVKNQPDTQISKAKRIICFFDNNTFTEYFPSKE